VADERVVVHCLWSETVEVRDRGIELDFGVTRREVDPVVAAHLAVQQFQQSPRGQLHPFRAGPLRSQLLRHLENGVGILRAKSRHIPHGAQRIPSAGGARQNAVIVGQGHRCGRRPSYVEERICTLSQGA
jgi:hypothetical protein